MNKQVCYQAENLSPAQIEAFERLKVLFKCLGNTAVDILNKLVAGICSVIKAALKIFRRVYEGMLRKVSKNPRWYHLYKYSKNRRVRKKYEKRLRERLARYFKEGVT